MNLIKFLVKLLLFIGIFGYLYGKFSKKKPLRLNENNQKQK